METVEQEAVVAVKEAWSELETLHWPAGVDHGFIVELRCGMRPGAGKCKWCSKQKVGLLRNHSWRGLVQQGPYFSHCARTRNNDRPQELDGSENGFLFLFFCSQETWLT